MGWHQGAIDKAKTTGTTTAAVQAEVDESAHGALPFENTRPALMWQASLTQLRASQTVGHEQMPFSGFLRKRGHKINHQWRRRFFLLIGSKLYYFANWPNVTTLEEISAKTRPRGVLILSGCQCVMDEDEIELGNPFSFRLTTVIDDRVTILQASNQSEMDMWIDQLNACSTAPQPSSETSPLRPRGRRSRGGSCAQS